MFNTKTDIKNFLKKLPKNPGIYLFKNQNRQVIYVGKAKNISNRVHQYFNRTQTDIKTSVMVKLIRDIEYIICNSELDALLLENNFIKKFKPRFNIKLKNSRIYPYIELTLSERYPRLLITRTITDKKNEYYGPFASSRKIRRLVRTLQRFLHIRQCNRQIKGTESKACINFQINKCCGPCIRKVTYHEYKKKIDIIRAVLRGHVTHILPFLQEIMYEYSKDMNYEEAANVRDLIKWVKEYFKHSSIVLNTNDSIDVISIEKEFNNAAVYVLYVRNGTIMAHKKEIITDIFDGTKDEILESFITHRYRSGVEIPKYIYIDFQLQNRNVLTTYLKKINSRFKNISIPQRGHKNELKKMASANATNYLKNYIRKNKINIKIKKQMLNDMKKSLTLMNYPNRIVLFDISNISGKNAVGGMSMMYKGELYKKGYRKFKIRDIHEINDYEMMKEVLNRYIKRIIKKDFDFPDVIILDGGKGHLGYIKRYLKEKYPDVYNKIDLLSIAKKEEIIFHYKKKESIKLNKDNTILKHIQLLRNEAHRFAITYHRKLRDNKLSHSILETIPGVGYGTANKLLKHIKDFQEIKKYSINDLYKKTGIQKNRLEKIKRYIEVL